MAETIKYNIAVDKKNTLKHIVTSVLTIVTIIAAIAVGLTALSYMTYVATNYNANLATNFIDILAPDFNHLLATGASKEALEDKLASLHHLEFLSYSTLNNENGEVVAEWQRPGTRRIFKSQIAKRLGFDTMERFGTVFYIKTPLEQNSRYSVMLAIDALHVMSAQAIRFRYFYLWLLLGVFIVGGSAIYFATKHLIRPLTNVGTYASKMIATNDLTITLPKESYTEISQLTVVINTLTGKMHSMLLALKDTCNAFEEIASELNVSGNTVSNGSEIIRQHSDNTMQKMTELVDFFSQVSAKLQELIVQTERGSATVFQMGEVNQKVLENVSAMNSSVEQSTSAIAKMNTVIQKTGDHVQKLNNDIESVNNAMARLDTSIANEEKSARDSIELSKELAINAENGIKALKETVKGIGKIKKSAIETSKVVAKLAERAIDIGNILHVIDDVTNQTNLLAMNAAIISSQAGEHGRGFAVIADEISVLANHTNDYTKEISELITTIQEESKRAITVMEESSEAIERGAKLGVDAAHAFGKLKESADKSSAQASALSAATIEQAADVKAVTDAIKMITSMVSEINKAAQCQGEEAEALNNAVGEMNTINQRVAHSSEEQERSAHEVLKAIENISEMAGLVNKSQMSQTTSTNLAVSTVKEVNNYIKSQNKSSRQLADAIKEIKQQTGKLTQYTGEFKI